ncbi:MAG: hypothetical protein PHQ00_02245 [Phycisphaerae bacterium]|nr:hypothetical protein [Phycisphaerae bacterium]
MNSFSIIYLRGIGKFLLIVIFITAMFFPGLCLAEESATEKEYKSQKEFMRLQSCVDNEDYIRAKFIWDDFRRGFSDTQFYKKYAVKINGLANQIRKNTKDIKFEDKIEYVFIRPRPESKQWKDYMSDAERIISMSRSKPGITVLRAIFEDETLESPSVRIDRQSGNELNIYGRGGGYSVVSYEREGPIFVGSEFWRYRKVDPNNNDISTSGDIVVGGIYHYPTKLKIDVQRGKANAYGEIFVRTIPKEFCGDLKVNVEPEEGLRLADIMVSLKAAGFYSGKNQPLEEGSCLFRSVGPGKYVAGLAKHNIVESPGQSVEVVTGQTSEVTIKAYKRRLIEFDWRFRRTDGPYDWLSGRKIVKSDNSWQPRGEWPNVSYPVIGFTNWTQAGCNIRSSNGELMLVITDESFEKMDFPSKFSPFAYEYPVKKGDVFAWRNEDRDSQQGAFLQAIIRIRDITPLGQEDPNSSVQDDVPASRCSAGSCKVR